MFKMTFLQRLNFNGKLILFPKDAFSKVKFLTCDDNIK